MEKVLIIEGTGDGIATVKQVKQERMTDGEECETRAGTGVVQGAGAGVGRMLDSSQAEDRRLIALVRARPLLYARSDMPVASYYAQCKRHWQEVADLMGRSVAEVRRKWSHIRNSYSRHLRNEVVGARTGRGRVVSRWYLADELHFLRAHMATDMRTPSSMSSTSSFSQYAKATLELPVAGATAGATAEGEAEAWGGAGVEAVYARSEAGSSQAQAEDEGALVAFFRGLQADWLQLRARRRRLYLRQCLALLHALLDEQDACPPSPAPSPPPASILPS